MSQLTMKVKVGRGGKTAGFDAMVAHSNKHVMISHKTLTLTITYKTQTVFRIVVSGKIKAKEAANKSPVQMFEI